MASFCIATGQTPDVYRSLTRAEKQEFIKAFNKANKRK